MPVLFNSIGTAEFFDLTGPIYPRQPSIELITRPGADGVGARNTGTKGEPFKLKSVCFWASFDEAWDAMASYVALKGSLQVLVRNSTVHGNVIVVAVKEFEPAQAVMNAAGAPGSECRAEVEWELVMAG